VGTLKEDYERRKHDRKKPEARLSVREWVLTTLSVAAFLVSLGATYFTVVRKSEKVSASVFEFPVIARYKEDENILVANSREADIVIVNSGDVSAAVLMIELIAFHLKDDATQGCSYSSSDSYAATRFSTDFKATTLKGKDVLTAHFSLKPPMSRDGKPSGDIQEFKQSWYSFPVIKENIGKNSFDIALCARVLIATPTDTRHEAFVPIFISRIEGTGLAIRRHPADEEFSRTIPKVIYENSWTIFSNY
jgi:hypothetical protein